MSSSLPPSPGLTDAQITALLTYLSLPSTLAALFASPALTTPLSRTSIPAIRNRRLTYALSSPPPAGLSAFKARYRHPLLYDRLVGSSVIPPLPTTNDSASDDDDDDDEEAWGQNRGVMGRGATHGKFGEVLGAFEEERRDERVREVRREEGRRERETGEEFDEDSSDEEEEEDEKKETGDGGDVIVGGGTVEETLEAFERAIREKWLAGLEDGLDYDSVDFNESYDPPLALEDAQEDWFMDESPGSGDGVRDLEAEGEYDY